MKQLVFGVVFLMVAAMVTGVVVAISPTLEDLEGYAVQKIRLKNPVIIGDFVQVCDLEDQIFSSRSARQEALQQALEDCDWVDYQQITPDGSCDSTTECEDKVDDICDDLDSGRDEDHDVTISTGTNCTGKCENGVTVEVVC